MANPLRVERSNPNDPPRNLAELREDIMRWRIIDGRSVDANTEEDLEWFSSHAFKGIFGSLPVSGSARAIRMIDYLEELMDVFGDDGNDTDLSYLAEPDPAPTTTDGGLRNCNHPCQGCWNGCHHTDDEDAPLLIKIERERQIDMLAAVIHRDDHPGCTNEVWSDTDRELARKIVDAGWKYQIPPMTASPDSILQMP